MKHILSKTNDCELTGVQHGDSQPNAVDLRVKKIFEINKKSPFIISEEDKTHRGSIEVESDEEEASGPDPDDCLLYTSDAADE